MHHILCTITIYYYRILYHEKDIIYRYIMVKYKDHIYKKLIINAYTT